MCTMAQLATMVCTPGYRQRPLRCRSDATLLPTGVVFFGLKVFGSLRHSTVAPVCVT